MVTFIQISWFGLLAQQLGRFQVSQALFDEIERLLYGLVVGFPLDQRALVIDRVD
jgi:hypothetical protein